LPTLVPYNNWKKMQLLWQKETRETNDCTIFEVIFFCCKLKIVIISRRMRRLWKKRER
jgi:hypothetical protein